MVLRSISTLLLFFLTLSGCAHQIKPIPRDIASLNANGGMAGIWFLQGTSSAYGPYNGELELRAAGDGMYNVTRIATYINYFYDGLKVQEVWQGKAVANEDTLTISYELKQGDFITKIGTNIKKTTKDLQTPLTINMRFLPTTAGLEAKFNNKRETEYSEWITTIRPHEAEPIWVDKRTVIQENAPALTAQERKKVQSAQKVLNYSKDPFVQSYRQRPEFKYIRTTIIQDRTDLDFYKSEPNILRIVNKVTDEATIAETVSKRNAYYPSLQNKAEQYDEATRRNFSNANLVVIKRGNTEAELIPDNLDSDAVFTTGFYVAAQAMRFHETKSNDAIKNIQRALQGLRLATEVSFGSASVAAGVSPIPADKATPNNWKAAEAPHAGWMWTSEKQDLSLLGMIHGLTWVTIYIPPAQQEIHQQIKTIVTALIEKDSRMMNPLNRGALHGLAALVLKNASSAEIFNSTKPPTPGTYSAGSADWLKEFTTLIQAAQYIQVSKAIHNSYKEDEWKNFLNVEFNVFKSVRRPLRILMTDLLAANNSEERTALKSWALQALEEIPYPRVQSAITIDHSGDSRWTVSAIPRGYWQVTDKNRQPVQEYYQGLSQIPTFELLGYTSRFLWKEDAFQYQTTSLGQIEATGVDYLYAYWLGRVSGAVNNQ